MARRVGRSWSVLFSLLAAVPAHAVSVTNRDDKEHTLTIVEGDSKQQQVLKPAQLLDGVCLKGCIIRVGTSENDEYELEGSEIVSIEDGYLYYDGPDAAAETAPGVKPEPPPSSSPAPAQPAK
jgi:hypothetical protein